MKPTRNALNAGCAWARGGPTPTQPFKAQREFILPKKPLTLAEKLQALRALQRENDREPVDEFFRRGESSTRFAYFD